MFEGCSKSGKVLFESDNQLMKKLLLNHTTIVLPDSERANASVLIADGKIAAVPADGVRVEADITIDLTAHKLLPGFIDIHNHGSVGIDVMETDVEGLLTVSQYLASQGVTGWLPTLVPSSDENYSHVAGAIEGASREPKRGARVLGIHYEGPFVNSAQCGALHQEYFKTYTGPGDLNCLRTPTKGSRLITLAPEVDGGVELVSELNKQGWVTSIGHTRADIELLDTVFEKGARHMTHFMNAMPPLHHRNPGPVGWGLARDGVTFDIIADGIHLDPSILLVLMKVKGAGSISLISDAIAATGKGDGDYQIWGESIKVRNRRTSNAAGSIAGSVISMQDAVRLMRSLGVTDLEIAHLASMNPARLLGIDSEYGSIEEGKQADLVAIDIDGKVRLTIVAGEIVFRS